MTMNHGFFFSFEIKQKYMTVASKVVSENMAKKIIPHYDLAIYNVIYGYVFF